MKTQLTAADFERLARTGRSREDIERQLALLAAPPAPIRLAAPCRLGDGIVRLRRHQSGLRAAWKAALRAGRLSKFVPASGAATRMFAFIPDEQDWSSLSLAELEGRARHGHEPARSLLEAVRNVRSFPFFADLVTCAERESGRPWSELLEARPVYLLRLIADPRGLGLASVPKGLLPFHAYAGGISHPLDEQVAEAHHYLADDVQRRMALHFTVAGEHHADFRSAAVELATRAAESGAPIPEIDFSLQDPATDTLALDSDGRPLRAADGSLAFRPGGHGSLLTNLTRLLDAGADIVFMKNIDNVTRRRGHELVGDAKRLLAGHLLKLESRCHELLDGLDHDHHSTAEALQFLTASLTVRAPHDFRHWSSERRAAWARRRLDRPLRVCGVVRNRGEPGGGPFWVTRTDGSVDGQIVESSQVDHGDPEQDSTWSASSHFNPVDIVCSLRDRRGRPFDLPAFVDHSTAFIASKPHAGGLIRALERPGLWNGAMADWNTSFVEVPEETFAPVKTLLDLLRPAHQPRRGAD